jgi:hypothetical protein
MLKNLLPIMQSYMFTNKNMAKGYNSRMQEHIVVEPVIREATVAQPITIVHHVPAPIIPAKPFTPFQKDKLFWCFFIILKGYEEYEMNHSNSFSLEKKIKIETVEKLKSIKEKLKELKLKRTELEDNLVNHQTISIKGLCALCLVHNISITYVYGRKYYEINKEAENEPGNIKGIIMENSLRWNDKETDEFMTNVRANYWLIDNIQKPLKAPTSYALKDLQEICQKLQINLEITVNEKTKQKTKSKLYEEILSHV